MTDIIARIDKLLNEMNVPGMIGQRPGKPGWWRVSTGGDWRGPYASKDEALAAQQRALGGKPAPFSDRKPKSRAELLLRKTHQDFLDKQKADK